MRESTFRLLSLRSVLVGLSLAVIGSTTGCQVEIGGQTMPSPYYMDDDVQYFAPGPEMPLAREAAALRERAQAEAVQNP